MKTVAIAYDLGEHGWASMLLRIGSAQLEIREFGDCTDALGDLLRAALAICAGDYRRAVSLDGEPYEWRVLLQRRPYPSERETIGVEVRGFADIHACGADQDGELLFSASCEADDFGAAIAEAANRVLSEHGLQGYAERWRLEAFPLRALTALTAALGTVEPPSPRLSSAL